MFLPGFGMSRKFLTHHIEAKKRQKNVRTQNECDQTWGWGLCNQNPSTKPVFSDIHGPYRTSMSAHVAGIFRQRNWCDRSFKSLKSEKNQNATLDLFAHNS